MSGEYNYIHDLSDEQLDRLLFQLAENDHANVDFLESVLNEKESREKAKSENNLSEISKVWDEFQHKYNGVESEEVSLYDCSDIQGKEVSNKITTKRGNVRVIKKALLVAAVFCLCFFMMATALGYNIFQAIGTWSKEVFSFVYSEDNVEDIVQNKDTETKSYNSFQDALDALGITEYKAPEYLPDGFSQTSVLTVSHQMSDEIQSFYASESQYLIITITMYENPYCVQYEKDENPVEELIENGINFYLFSNNGRSVATWNENLTEGFISGDISIEELKEVIKSMC